MTEQLNVRTDTKTHDNVTVSVGTAILYRVDENKVFEAFFKLTNVGVQMQAFVDDVVRSTLPTKTLDQAYEAKEDMSHAVQEVLESAMTEYGIIIQKVLVVDLQPDNKVLMAMNEINTQKRTRAAAQEKAEADKILKIKDAEAEMEAKHLAGKGVAEMRIAITKGCQESIDDMTKEVGLAPHDVVHMMLVTQYLDTLKDFATSGRSAVMVNGGNSPEDSVRQGFLTAGMLGSGGAPPPPPGR